MDRSWKMKNQYGTDIGWWLDVTMTVDVLIGPWMLNFHDGLEDVCSEFKYSWCWKIFVLNSIPIRSGEYFFYLIRSVFGDDFFHQQKLSKIDSLPKIPQTYLKHIKNPEWSGHFRGTRLTINHQAFGGIPTRREKVAKCQRWSNHLLVRCWWCRPAKKKQAAKWPRNWWGTRNNTAKQSYTIHVWNIYLHLVVSLYHTRMLWQ